MSDDGTTEQLIKDLKDAALERWGLEGVRYDPDDTTHPPIEAMREDVQWRAAERLQMLVELGEALGSSDRLKRDGRLETGVVQEPGDWPGVFIRGDDAFALSLQIRGAMEQLGPEPPTASVGDIFMRHGLQGIAELLESCDMRKNPKPQMVRRVAP